MKFTQVAKLWMTGARETWTHATNAEKIILAGLIMAGFALITQL